MVLDRFNAEHQSGSENGATTRASNPQPTQRQEGITSRNAKLVGEQPKYGRGAHFRYKDI